MTEKTPRWLDLVAFLLQRGSPVTREEIFRRVGAYKGAPETARRKFERDKDELRALGIQIDTVQLTHSAGDTEQTGYRLRARGTYLPYLELVNEPPSSQPYPGLEHIALSREELDVLDRATRALAEQGDNALALAAASARRKLAFDLPLQLSSVEHILAAPMPEHVRDALAILQEAVIAHRAITCSYFTMSRGVDAERVLEPWGLIFQWSRWYCVARARDRDDPRLFRLDRMRNVKRVDGPEAKFDVPRGFDVRSFVGHSPWELGNEPPVAATVRFRFPESRWIVNQRVGEVVRDEGETVLTRFAVRDQDAFIRWLLSFGRQAELVEPASLRDALDALRADVAALYAEAIP